MPKHALVSSLIGFALVGAVTAGGIAMASDSTELALTNGSARYIAPSGDSAGSATFTADVRDDSGVRSLKVLAWPGSSKLDPTAAELRHTNDATCRSASDDTSRCTYTLKVTKKEASRLDRGTWYVSALATAKDGDTVFVPHAATLHVND
ncbi:DUF5707 domain-containing protein [Streptomyces sp. NPDC005551]|uniref:DUF5707 domain-containing protein n=1 Tax=Streptomyces sp. NPDC005551 TaxID=3364725 RepID=UPI003690A525